MIDLLNIDIITVNCTNPNDGVMAIKHCCKFFNFGRKILFTDSNIKSDDIETINIQRLKSVDEYNDFILSLHEYVKNEYVLIVQDDGFIINPNLWDYDFLNYDYIGAPWPSHEDENWLNHQNPKIRPYLAKNLSKNRTGNGGFSLRSKKFIEYSYKFKSCHGVGEDCFLCIQNYDNAVENGIRFAPFDLSLKFSKENPLDNENKKWTPGCFRFDESSHFGFHGKNFENSEYLINLKNI